VCGLIDADDHVVSAHVAVLSYSVFDIKIEHLLRRVISVTC